MLVYPNSGYGLQAVAPPPIPLSKLVIGKPAIDVAALMPRLFNLCKTAQSVATRMALGMCVNDADFRYLYADIRREHQVKLSVFLPARIGIKVSRIVEIDKDMTLDQVCKTYGAGLICAVRDTFGCNEAVTSILPDHIENSVAGRQKNTKLMREIENKFGRGPLWRLLARYLEFSRIDLPMPTVKNGWALVPAARGTYAVRAKVKDGYVTEFERITPTDIALVKGGIIEQTLASLPKEKSDMAQLVLDIIDPCVPLTLRKVDHA